MVLDDSLAQREAYPTAGPICSVQTLKNPKNLFVMFWIDPGTVVLHRKDGCIFFPRAGNMYQWGGGPAIIQSVSDQVLE